MYISQLTDEDSFAQSLNKDIYVQYALRILKNKSGHYRTVCRFKLCIILL